MTVRLAAAYGDPALLKFHLDLVANLPHATPPPVESLARARAMLAQIAGIEFPDSFSDKDVLLVGTGRRASTDAECAALGDLAAKLPLPLG